MRNRFDEGLKQGYEQRDRESFMRGSHPFENWRWDEWFAYTGMTVVSIGMLVLVIWLAGIFIRWEVGSLCPSIGGEINANLSNCARREAH